MNPETITLGDFVQQLLLNFRGEQLHFSDERPWQELFFEFKSAPESPGKPAFFRTLFFDWNGPYPRCQELSDFLHGLHWTGCMSASNPTYDKFTLNQEVGNLWQDVELDGALHQFLADAAGAARNELMVGYGG